jgi:hypothetical protein
VTPSIGMQFGSQVWTNAREDKIYLVAEGRLFTRTFGAGLSNNYLFWAGMRTKVLSDLIKAEGSCPQKMENYIFAMGFLLGRNHLRGRNNMFSDAKGLISAQKASGQALAPEGPIGTPLGETLMRELLTTKQRAQEIAIKKHMVGNQVVIEADITQ